MKTLLVLQACALAALLLVGNTLAQSTDSTGETKYLYRIYYRSGSQGEWQEAIEAGSPVTGEEKAIEIAKLVREKFDYGGLAAFEVEVRKFKIITRPATEEEQRTYGEADAGAAPTAVSPTLVVSPPARTEAAPHAGAPTTGHRRPGASGHGDTTTLQPQDDSGESPREEPVKFGETTSADNASTPSNGNGPSTASPELTMNEGVRRTKVQTATRVVINANSTTDAGENPAPRTPPASDKVGTLDDLIARLQRESEAGSAPVQPVVALLPAVGPASSLDPSFFQGQAARPVPTQPAVARRIRVIRNGRIVAQTNYDATGTRIESRTTEPTASGEQSTEPVADGAVSERPEAELTMNENAPRGGETPATTGADQEQAAALQKDREMLTKLQADLNAKQSELDQETKRLDDERTDLDREKESLSKRGQELRSRETQLARPSLEGRTASGTMQGGQVPLSIQFYSGGRLDATDNKKTYPGTWSQSGSSVTITASHSTLTGTLSGNTISGGRNRTDGLSGDWSVTLSGSSTATAASREELSRDRARLQSDQAAHDGRQKAHQQASEQVRSSRLRLQAEQGRYEDAFARHRQQTLEFNSRPR